MTAGRPFAFAHDQVSPAPRSAQNADEITAPLPDFAQGRPTLPVPESAEPPAPVALPFRAPVTSDVAPLVRVTEVPPDVVPVVPPYVKPVATRKKRRGAYVATGAALLALYSAALVALVAPRRAADVPADATPAASTLAPALSAAPLPEAGVSAPAPVASVSTLAPSPPASAAAAPVASESPHAQAPAARTAAPRATSPYLAPPRTPRPPTPARTARPVSDVVNPWMYD